MTIVTLRGWPTLFWQIAECKGLWIAYVIFSIIILFVTFMTVNLFAAIFIVAFRTNHERNIKREWLKYYPGLIDDVKELELFRWAFTAGDVLAERQAEASDASVITSLFRFIWSKVDPSGHAKSMKNLEKQKEAWYTSRDNIGKSVEDRLGKVPWRPCLPPCTLWEKMREVTIKDNSPFNTFIIIAIIGNILLMATESDDASSFQLFITFWLYVMFNAIFAFEILVKITLLGPIVYLDSAFNLFDVFLVLMGLLQYGADVPRFLTNLRIIRLLRLARLYKLVKLVNASASSLRDPTITFKRLMNMAFDLIAPMCNALLMTLIFLYVFSLIGMQFLIFPFKFNDHLVANTTNTNVTMTEEAAAYNLFDAFGGNTRDRMNFNTFGNAFVTVFNIMFFNGWHVGMLETLRGLQNSLLTWYYILLIFLCNYFTIATLTATVTNIFDEGAKRTINEMASYNAGRLDRLCDLRRKCLLYSYFSKFKTGTVHNEEARQAASVAGVAVVRKPIIIEESFSEPMDTPWLEQFQERRKDYSFYLFQPILVPDDEGRVIRNFNVRFSAEFLLKSYPIQICIWIALLWAVLGILSVEESINDLPLVKAVLDYFIIAVFLFEMLLKSIVAGVDGYLARPMNWVDVLTNVAMILALIFPNLVVLNRVRILRLIKIPEMVMNFSSSLSLRLLVTAIEEAPASLLTLCIVFCLFIFFFAVIGLQSWSSQFYRCSDPMYPGNYPLFESIPGYPNGCDGIAYVKNKYDDHYYWVQILTSKAQDNFDNIFDACKAVFRIFTLSEFQNIVYSAMDTTDDGYQPKNNFSRATFIYFLVAGILVITILELLMATIYYHFTYAQLNYKRKRAFGLMAAAWQSYEDKLRHVDEGTDKRETLNNNAKTTFQKLLAKVLSNDLYALIIFLYTTVPLILFMAFFQQTYSQTYFAFIDIIFSFFYLADYLARFSILGRKMLVKDGKHEVVIVGCLAISIFNVFPAMSGTPLTSYQLKFTWACLMLRMYRLGHATEFMMNLLRTMQMSLSGVVPTALYLIMTVLIYAVLGKSVFESYQLDYGYKWINDHFNFSTYNHAIITLCAIGTGNFFTETINALKANTDNFGMVVFIELYFTTFAIASLVLIKSFALMVIIKYVDQTGGDLGIAGEQIRDFQHVWRGLRKVHKMTDLGTVVDCIDWHEFEVLIRKLNKPLGLKGEENKWIVLQRFAKQVLLCMPCESKYFEDLDGIDIKDPSAWARNKKRRDLYRIEGLPEDLSLLQDKEQKFTFMQCLIAFHKAAITPAPLEDDEKFQASRALNVSKLGRLRMAIARLCVSEVKLKDPPHAVAYRTLQILQRLDADLYREVFLKVVGEVFENLSVHVNAYGFQPFDAFVLSVLFKTIRSEKRSCEYGLQLRKKLKASGHSKYVQMYLRAQAYSLSIMRLFNSIERMYETNVSQKWEVASIGKILQVRDRKPISAIEVDMLSNIYVASGGSLKVWKNLSGDAAVTKDSKFKKIQTIDFEKEHIRCIIASPDGKRFYVGAGKNVFFYMATGAARKGKKGFYREIRQFSPAHSDNVNDLLIFGKYLISCASDGIVALWLTTTFERIITYDAGAPVFCLVRLPIHAPGVPKGDLALTDALVCGTARGEVLVLDLPMGRKGEEKTLWTQPKVEVLGEHNDKSLVGHISASVGLDDYVPVTTVCYAWTYLFVSLADGSVHVFATVIDADKIGKTEDGIMSFFQLSKVSGRRLHNAPITGLRFAGDHVFTCSHDFSLLPFLAPESLSARLPTQFEQEVGQGIVLHSAPILCMASNNHVLVTGDNSGVINVLGPARSDVLLSDGSAQQDLTSQVHFSFLEYDFGNVLCAHQGKSIEEECYLMITNFSESTVTIRWVLRKSQNWVVETSRSDLQPRRVGKKALFDVQTNESITFRIIFSPTEAKFYRCGIDFLLNESVVVTIHAKGTGVTPKVASDKRMVDFDTVDVININASSGGVVDGELRVLNLYCGSNAAFPCNFVEEVFYEKPNNPETAYTISDRNISIAPRAFNIGPQSTAKENTELIVKFSPSAPYPTFDVPLKFNIGGAVYTLATLRFRSAEKKKSQQPLTLANEETEADSPAAASAKALELETQQISLSLNTLGVPGRPMNLMAVSALPKGLRPLRPSENICNTNMIMGLLAHRGWRYSADDVLSCFFHVDSGVFLEIPRQIEADEVLNHVESVSIDFTVDKDCYWELWHDEINVDRGFGKEHEKVRTVVEKDLLYVRNTRKRRDASGMIRIEEVWTECIGRIVLELLIFVKGRVHRMGQAPHKPKHKMLLPETDPEKRLENGYLSSRTDIVIHKGFRLAVGEDGLGYDFLDRMDVSGIERICLFSDDGICSLYETFSDAHLPKGRQVSPTFGSVTAMIHSSLPGDVPTHYKVKDITGQLAVLHPEDALETHPDDVVGDKHISTLEDQIVNIDGQEIVSLGRPHGLIAMRDKDSRDSRAQLGRVVEVFLLRHTEVAGASKHLLLNPASVQPAGTESDPSKKRPSTILNCHTMLNMAARSKASNVSIDHILPHNVHSPSHSVHVAVLKPDEEPELRITKLSSMIDEMKGHDVVHLSSLYGHVSSSVHEGSWHFVLDGNELKLVSADTKHGHYHDNKTSTDIYLLAHGFIATLDNEAKSVLYCDEGYAIQIDDLAENLERGYLVVDQPRNQSKSKGEAASGMLSGALSFVSGGLLGNKSKPQKTARELKPQRFDNYMGVQVHARPAPRFLTEIWGVRCADAFVDGLRRALFKLLERRQHYLQAECERIGKEMLKEVEKKEPEIRKRRGDSAVVHARQEAQKAILELESKLVHTRPTDKGVAKLVFAETIRSVGEFLTRREEEKRKQQQQQQQVAEKAGGGGGAKAKAGAGAGGDSGPSQAQALAATDKARRDVFTAGKLIITQLQDFLEGVTLPGRDEPFSKALAERVLRGLDRDGATGAVSPDTFFAWYDSKPSAALMKDLTERTIFARLLEDHYNEQESESGKGGFVEEDVHMGEDEVHGDSDMQLMGVEDEMDLQGLDVKGGHGKEEGGQGQGQGQGQGHHSHERGRSAVGLLQRGMRASLAIEENKEENEEEEEEEEEEEDEEEDEDDDE